ncbi:unnamed protein product [Triticum turgidum subsp. durum]|uniref:Phytocyanin domain-containing protein n=1 Tax=Triticum turgidum subsp. durum TaxID=4567 RepID=A0A9R1BQ76_TRITD|nr:unnamed protein product [Triticum turgidum subsp. durum]
MAAATRALLVAAVTAAALFGTALGATYTVGAPAGSWDLRTNYTRWTSTISSSSPVATFPSGNDVIPLAAVGTRYFICGLPGHCAGGMKVQVNVQSKARTSKDNPKVVTSVACASPNDLLGASRIPLVSYHFMKAAPQKLGGNASEEYVVIALDDLTKRTMVIIGTRGRPL